MKDKLKILNEEFKEKTFDLLQPNKSQFINHLKNHKEEYLKLNELQRFVAIGKYVDYLSFYKDDEVISVIKNLGLVKYTPKIFVCYLDIFNSLDKYQEETKYLYPYETIWGFYTLHSSSVIKEKMALDFNMDLAAIAGRVNRQINNLNFPPFLKEVIEENQNLFELIKKEIPNYKINISEKNPFTSIAHTIKYSHKNELYNLYMFLVDFNKKVGFIKFYEPDFKVEFYDLLEIVLREKSIIDYTDERIKEYKTLRRFKIKQVERLILS
ncbi:hypothetical protein SAMN05428642_103189 [Flaviramulus basaltis]|uniref:Uncharacterized protein n=1 Tax=Flaviramulus basaltis TaxID=369401 RepID=A0A1K2IME0_9FLAO|nr:hypothetical protein [Flaviramulus basaltis]SFZ93535.1 hypothetical protein SAMN05428642_103189 [Flaviramulus basaltis]